MKPKNVIRALLLLFVAGSLAYMVLGNRRAPEETESAADSDVDPELAVYFFYNDIRCEECLKIEEYAREALDTHFSGELASGIIAWRPLSMDAPENKHYLTEYELFSKSVVLVKLENGEEVRWKNLEEIWDLIYDKPAYVEYIRSNIEEFLQAPS